MSGRRRYIITLPLLAVAIASFVFVRNQQNGGALLIQRQRQAQALTTAAVERVVRVAPDPVTNKPGRSADCTPRGQGALRNPWTCTIRYRSGRVISYTLTLNADGSYAGGDEVVRFRGKRFRDTGTINGCCVTIS